MSSSKNSPSKEELVSSLHSWISNEMKYKASGTRQPPISTLFLQKLCVEDMNNVWAFLIHHVKSAENTQKVRQKIKQHHAKMEMAKIEAKEERETLLERKKSLTEKILEKKANLRKLEQEIERLKNRVSTEGDKAKAVQTQIKEEQLRDACLRNYERELLKMTEILREYENRITKEAKKIQNEANENNNNNNSFTMNEDDQPTNAIKQICESISKHVNETGATFSPQSTESLQSTINQLVQTKQLTPKDIITALDQNSRDHANKISNSVSTFTSSPNNHKSDSPSQSQQLHQIRIEHSNIFFETQKLLNKAAEIETQCKNQLASFPMQSTELTKLIGLEISQIGLKGAQTSIQEYERVLVNIVNSAKVNQQKLQENFVILTQYEKQKHQKQEEISRLMELNVQQRREIQKKVKTILQFLHSRLVPLELTIRPLCSQLINYGARDIEMFRKIPLHKLLAAYQAHSPYNKTVDSLSIHASLSLHNLISYTNFPIYKGMDSLLPFILALKQKHFEEQSNQNLENVLKSHTHQNSTHNHADFIDKTEKECQTNTAQFILHYTPTLHTSIQESKQGLEMAKNVMKTAEEWWIQPAQHLLPWMKVENLNVSNWIENWHKLVILSTKNPSDKKNEKNEKKSDVNYFGEKKKKSNNPFSGQHLSF
eukprot:TRINITY_DN1279_c1_g1_i1.p1 TRINITY_DN1279_c1_g1~~TRINITY_DN1279_c1_g1_i1.p1  ORF type:complete len:657 (-),score=186.47 TRINITY_DN1279_c1_g1_i1:76-2046(-)